MLHRAASNAYSWWWASHIRTKQSKWLEQNLQDMEEKVQDVLKLIEEDGDSFAKRAEMYYKKRPELINFVEESYRAYRALAERYDHISTELQNANNTIAYVFPEQVQFAMEDDEEEATAKFPKKFPPEASKANVPKVPKIPKDFKSVITSATKKLQPKKSMKIAASSTPVVKSGLSKSEGIQEIDKLQKQVLALQTEKEFVKSSYENRLAKYWEIEQQIREIQEKVCSLQDEFGAGTFIKDDEARTLMAAAALKSCQETLAQLQEKEERSAEEAAIEFKRISNAREKLKTLKVEFLPNQIDHDESLKAVEELQNLDQEESSTTKEKQDLELVREKIKEHYEVEFNSSMTVTELAEKIDELVNKVVSLEAAVSSQAALIQRLKTETGGLQSQIQTMEDDKATLTSDKNNLSNKLREMEEKLRRLQDLNQSFEDQNNNLRTHFTEAHCNLDHLSERMHSVKPDEELQVTVPIQSGPLVEVKSQEESKGEESALIKQQNLKLETDLKVTGKEEEEQKEGKGAIHPNDGLEDRQNPDKEHKISDSSQKAEESSAEAGLLNQLEEQEEKTSNSDGTKKGMDTKSEDCKMEGLDPGPSNTIAGENASPLQTSTKREISLGKVCNQKMEEHDMQASPTTLCNTQQQKTMEDDEPDWKQLFTDCLEDREKVLLKEYTTTLRNYKEVKKKLAEAEKGKGDSLFDNTLQLKELKSANAKKDDQIRFLYQKLSLLQANFSEDNESDKSTATESTATEKRIAEDIKLSLLNQQEASSEIEQRFRMNIDEVLEENLDFWMRFSSTFQQIQKFETEVHDLQFELSRLEEKQKKQDGSSTARYSLKSDAKPLYKHLREKHAELSVWLEKSMLLKDELKSRFSSLCDIQEEIMAALKESAEDDDFKFTTHQAAKFQGEILNMKQENNKVADELQAGLDHVTALQLEAEKTLAKLNEVFRLSGSTGNQNAQQQHSESHSRVPLRSFIFGVKQRKHKHSLFSLVQPALHRKHNDFKSGPL